MTPARYSYSWAQSIIYRLTEKYARATETAKEILDITDRDLAKYLAIGDEVFPQIREMIHIVDNWENCANWQGWNSTNVKYLGMQIRRKGWERLADRIDKVQNSHRLKEQGSRGGDGRSESD